MMEANMMKEGNSDKEQVFAECINDKIKSIAQDVLFMLESSGKVS